MHVDILTLFPQMFDGFFDYSIIKRARERGLVDIKIHNIRDYTHDKHSIVDDYPYGGGAGMVLKPEPIFEAVDDIKDGIESSSIGTILLSPRGRLLNQEIVQQLVNFQRLILICGHYEGIDERVVEYIADDEISIGDYLLSGGEAAAMVLVDSMVRLLPGAIGSEASLAEETHTNGLLEYPQYTRPETYRNLTVPPVLLSGNHSQIATWRRIQSLLQTAKRRPDLLQKAVLSEEEKNMIDNIKFCEIKS